MNNQSSYFLYHSHLTIITLLIYELMTSYLYLFIVMCDDVERPQDNLVPGMTYNIAINSYSVSSPFFFD